MRVIFSIAASLFASYGATVDAARFSFLKKALGSKIRQQKPLVTQVNAFETADKACCACFRSKYAWPANAALGAAFAPKQTCDTCYVTDLYGIDAKAAVVFDVPKPKPDAPLPRCANFCDSVPGHPGCGYWHKEEGTGVEKEVSEIGPGACDRLFADPLFIEKTGGCDSPMIQFVCKTNCKVDGCGASEGAYENTDSKVEAVHEWNWNCASGNAPEDPQQWLKGPVEGEPESTRGPFIMCKEDAGWFCPSDEGEDLKLEAGADAPIEVDDGNTQISVGTMSLPVIDGAASVAESVSGF